MDNKDHRITVAVLAGVFVVSVVIAFVFKDDLDYRKAQNANTKEAYLAFMHHHPESEYYEKTKKL